MVIYKGKQIKPYESFYWNTTESFNRGQLGGGICRCIKTDDSLATLVMEEVKIIKEGNYHKSGHNASSIVNVNGLSPTVMENHGTFTAIVEPKIEQLGNIYPDKEGFKNRTSGRIYKKEGLCPTLRTVTGGNNEPKILENMEENQKYRIRKLTPRECFRLMGVEDKDIDKIQNAGISNSQQYKLAGNSIVVDVLYHIFRKMFIEKESESNELTLF